MHTYQSIEEVIDDLRESPVEGAAPVYHPIPFPEFADLPTSSNAAAAQRKLQLISDVISQVAGGERSPLRIVDIGANAGFYTFSLAKQGHHVLAVERHERYSAIARFLIERKSLDVRWECREFDCDLVRGRQFDFALMLSVFQWMAEGGRAMRYASEALRCTSEAASYLFFELGFNSGKSALRTRRINHYAQLIALLRKHSSYTSFRLLGKTSLWAGRARYLVVCSRDRAEDDNLVRRVQRYLHI